MLRKDQSFRQGKQEQGLGSPRPCRVSWGAAGPWWTPPHVSAALLEGTPWGCFSVLAETARDGRKRVVENLPITTSPPAHQGHREGDSLAGETATTGDTFHHQEMLVSQHLSSGKEKRQQWRKAGTQLGTLLIN